MIHEVTIPTAYRHGDVLGSMHRLRKQLYVDRLGWDVPVHEGMEYDQFDTLTARYLVGMEPDGTVRAAQRNLPCHHPYMLQSLLPDLVHAGQTLPRDTTWVEGTRSGVDQSLPPAAVQRWSNELLLANVEWALLYGFTNYTFVTYEIMVERVMIPNGLPVELWGKGDGTFVAGHFAITRELLQSVRDRTGIVEPVLVPLDDADDRRKEVGNVA